MTRRMKRPAKIRINARRKITGRKIQEPELHKVLEIVLRTTYGPEMASEEERAEVQNLYYFICRHLGKEQKGMSRFAFYLIDVWI